MIKLVYGAKGSGKTKRIIESANDAAINSKGDVVYITDIQKHSVEIKHTVKFVNFKEYGVCSPVEAIGFLKGVLSANHDITEVFIDGFARMTNQQIADMENEYKLLEALSAQEKTDFILTVSADEKDLPKFLLKFI